MFRLITAADGADLYEYRGATIHFSFMSDSTFRPVTGVCVRVDLNGQGSEEIQDEICGAWLSRGDALKFALEHAAELIDRSLRR